MHNPESLILKDFDFIKRSLGYETNGLQAVTYMRVEKCIIDRDKGFKVYKVSEFRKVTYCSREFSSKVVDLRVPREVLIKYDAKILYLF